MGSRVDNRSNNVENSPFGDGHDRESGGSGAHRWYVLNVSTGYERQVLYAVNEAIALAKIEHAVKEIILPTEEIVEVRAGKRRKSQQKFFPGYLFICMDMNDITWQVVRNASAQIRGFVGATRGHPVPLADAEVDGIKRRMEVGATKPRPKVLFEVGEVVRIAGDGPFKDFDATVEEVDYGKNRIRVNVLIFGRPTPLTLECDQVEKIT